MPRAARRKTNVLVVNIKIVLPMSDKKVIKALVVDDEKVVRDFLTRFLSLEDVEVEAVENSHKAIEAAKKEKFDIVIMEIRISDMVALEAFRELKKINPQSKYVMMSATFSPDNLLEQLKNEGATVCLKKPFGLDEIRNQLNEIHKNAQGKFRMRT